MAILNYPLILVRARRFQVWGCLALAVLVAVLYVTSCTSHAAPVTFRFEAEITDVAAGIPFELPLSFAEGDVVHGRFSFEPQVAPAGSHRLESLQSLRFELNINGKVLGSDTY